MRLTISLDVLLQVSLLLGRVDAGQVHAVEATVLFSLVPVGLGESRLEPDDTYNSKFKETDLEKDTEVVLLVAQLLQRHGPPIGSAPGSVWNTIGAA